MKRLVCTLALINFMIVSSFCQDTLKAVLVKDIKNTTSPNWSDNSSFPRNFVVLPDRLLFMAASSINSNFHDLWSTDGTAEGTRMVTTGNNTLGLVDVLDGFTAWGSQIIFTASDGARGYEPWLSDGTPGSARLLKDIKSGSNGDPMVGGSEPRYYRIFKGKAYFQAEVGYSHQLFVSDGTEAGTLMLTPAGTGDYHIFGFVAFKDQLFFSCQKNYMGGRLWVTDGTVEGTSEFKAIDQGEVSSLTENRWAMVYKNKLYFAASTVAEGMELWVSDGTPEGTRLYKDINKTNGQGSHPHGFTLLNDRLYFIANDGIHGNELWCMDEDSAMLVKDIGPGGGALDYAELFVDNNRMYMAAQPIDGFPELWTSDGTAEGTQKLMAHDGTTVEAPNGFVVWKGKIVFIAGKYNPQLWITDGTAQHTRPVFRDEVIPWAALRSNSELAIFKDDLYFNANYDPSIGCELYKLTVDTSLIPLNILQHPLSMNVCTGDSAVFEVKATGSPELIFQWMKNYGPIENATQSTYKIAHARIEDAGDYMCMVKNGEGKMVSKSAYLGVSDLSANFEVIDSTKNGFYLIKFTGNAPGTAVCQWDFDGGEILAGSGKGPYHVTWKNSGAKNITLDVMLNSCTSQAIKSVEIVATGNISPIPMNPVCSMYPNPVRENLTIDFNHSDGVKKVALFDAYGHVLLEKQTNNRSLVLPLSRLTAGLYSVRVQDERSVTVTKIVKE